MKPASLSAHACVNFKFVNPHSPLGGGLHELLGARVLAALTSMSGGKGAGLQIRHLADWMTG